MKKPDNWGYDHPDVKGPNALMFFTWDLSKTIELAFKDATEDTIEDFVQPAQASIDALIQKYIDIKADPNVFEGQSITLHVERNEGRNLLIALKTSEALEEKIIAMQQRTQAGRA